MNWLRRCRVSSLVIIMLTIYILHCLCKRDGIAENYYMKHWEVSRMNLHDCDSEVSGDLTVVTTELHEKSSKNLKRVQRQNSPDVRTSKQMMMWAHNTHSSDISRALNWVRKVFLLFCAINHRQQRQRSSSFPVNTLFSLFRVCLFNFNFLHIWLTVCCCCHEWVSRTEQRFHLSTLISFGSALRMHAM